MPFLALAAAAASDALNLSTQVAAFVSAIFSMLAYDLVRVIALRTLKKVDGDILKLPSDAAFEVPAGSGKPEVLTVQAAPAPPMHAELRKAIGTNGAATATDAATYFLTTNYVHPSGTGGTGDGQSQFQSVMQPALTGL